MDNQQTQTKPKNPLLGRNDLIERDAKGRITKPVPQETNKNGLAGAPTAYKPEYCELIVKFFMTQPFRKEKVIMRGKNWEKEEFKLIPNTLPTIERFAHKIGVNDSTVVEWTKIHPEFNTAYLRAKQLQKDILIQNGLNGLYDSKFAVFVAKNFTDMKDVSEVDNKHTFNVKGFYDRYRPNPTVIDGTGANPALDSGEERSS